MPITIVKDQDGTKFYGHQREPILVIYNGTQVAMLRDQMIDGVRLASEVAEAVAIAGLFVNSLNVSEENLKRNNIDARYFNEASLDTEDTKYSARKILTWLESDKIVTVNKNKRIKYQFTKFAFQNDKLIILYKPVVW